MSDERTQRTATRITRGVTGVTRSRHDHGGRQRLRIAWFSALPGGRNDASSSAYFTSEVLPLMRERAEIELFHDRFESYQDYPTFHFLSAFERDRKDPYDLFFYQLEDSAAANFVRAHLALIPGAVLFHDFTLRTFGPEPLLNSPWTSIVTRFLEEDEGERIEWPDRFAEHTQIGPLAMREAAFSLLPLFSSERDHAEYQREVTLRLNGRDRKIKGPSYFLPFPVNPELCQPPGLPVVPTIGFCGTANVEHRSHKFFLALSKLAAPHRLLWLIDEGEKSVAEERIREFGLTNVKLVLGRTPQHWAEVVSKSTVAVHTLFSAFGRTGPYLNISVMAGLPCIVTDYWGTSYLPDNIVFKVQPGESEGFEIEQVLSRLLQNKNFHSSTLVQQFAHQFYDSRIVAAELFEVLEHHAHELRHARRQWRQFEEDAKRALLTEAEGIASQRVQAGGASITDPAGAFTQLLRPVYDELGWAVHGEAA